ncbi:MAG: multiheme c-type cytochrome [Planctomycetota bacterium]
MSARRKTEVILGALVVLGPLAALGFLAARMLGQAPPAAEDYVGSESCKGCHSREHELWLSSDHRHALHKAADNPLRPRLDGEAAGVEPVYAMGWRPLQQVLVAGKDGRLQASPIAWDPAKAEWFHVFADLPEAERPGWESPALNANLMCLECHVTDYRKGYDRATGRYQTTWKEEGVGCEACHGPGARHVDWAKRGGEGEALIVAPKRLAPDRALDLCATCHTRRYAIADGFRPGDRLADFYAPELLASEEAYHPDGQIRGETYEYGSFLQSRMYAKGVRCSDCHEPHSGAVREQGNRLCMKCHKPELDAPSHHFHAAGSAGAACVGCHMPETTYMQRDPRRDHSFSVPSTETTVAYGVPNACNRCHADKTADWAAGHVERWYGRREPSRERRAAAFAAIRKGDAPSPADAQALLSAQDEPPVARAALAELLGPRAGEAGIAEALIGALRDADPLVRAGALARLPSPPPEALIEAASPLLRDPVRLVRVRAAWALRAANPARFDGWAAAQEEFARQAEASADNADVQFNLGVFWEDRGEPGKAEAAYADALRVDPEMVPALFNRAMVLHRLGRKDEAEVLWKEAVRLDPSLPSRVDEPK